MACIAGLPWEWEFPWEFPWEWEWDGYGNYDEFPWELWEFLKRICDWSDCDRSESFLNFVEYSQIMNVF